MFLSHLLSIWHRYRAWSFLALVIGLIIIYVKTGRHSRRQKSLALPAEKTSAHELVQHYERQKGHELVDKPGNPILVPTAQIVDDPSVSEIPNRERLKPKRVTGSKVERTHGKRRESHATIQPLIFYFSLTESYTKKYAVKSLPSLIQAAQFSEATVLAPRVYDLAIIDHEDFFEREPRLHQGKNNILYFYLILVPSYDIDTVLDNFLSLLKETHNDFRIDTAPLSNLAGYSVFGFGDREGWPTEAAGFCSQAFQTDKWMAKLTARKRAYPLGLGDVKSDVDVRFQEWTEGVLNALGDVANTGHLGEGVPGSGEAIESDEDDLESINLGPQIVKNRKTKQRVSGLGDLEDIGGKVEKPSPLPIDFTTTSHSQSPKAMVPITSPTHAALTKQGYTIIGTHSGVKICRWTKSALRGRGSCYKYSFYGIKSHLCMETTPSLSCSNKCVFCWRHGTNPVGTTWRWQVDPPDLIFQGAKESHYKKIKMMRGVPGVRAERFQEAMRIRHCALSLVGEPIFYPHINEFVAMLHKEHISSFLVCNAQHPDQLANLKPVTQLYVSIDASNAESLRKIDRPLHRDFWQRFCRCLDILREKRFHMRTVFRLTLVKGFNIEEEVEGYADLVAKGLPCFVEIKGVTYCGTSTSASAGLTMQNVPFYTEVVVFVEALNAALERRGLAYGIAAEHAHSCCALIASRRFFVREKWHTLIDYERFFECLNGGGDFSPEDYMGPPTPEWATWGKGGFDPNDQRVDRKGRVVELG